MTSRARILVSGDEKALDAFLRRHADSSLMMLSNLHNAGLADEGRPYQGTYFAELDGDQVIGVAAIYWSGAIILQVPGEVGAIADAIRANAPRPVTGILGPIDQAQRMRAALGMAGRACMLDSTEDLYALALDRIAVPDALARGEVTCRPAQDDEVDLLIAWRRDFMIESLDAPDDATTTRSSGDLIRRLQGEGINWVLEHDGRPVAYATYGARLPDAVQIGGVWTPRDLRRYGYGRAVVAGALLTACQRGVGRAVLFTDRANAASAAAYRAIGFTIVGDFALILFKDNAS
ncbi:MAG: GNAT family N-acetyltransferase [Alphaproteobacteria bacterium]|nr:GNAT family N-acetyltransferase [Alphaproteobacteria bacterium]